MEKGYIQVYTGNGKGKTTAALGLGLRAVGRGLKVVMFQFLKGGFSGELESARRLAPYFEIRRLAAADKPTWALLEDEKSVLREKFAQEYAELEKFIREGSADLVILDEVMAAVHYGLLNASDVCRLMEIKPQEMELVLTGRNAPPEILERADLVTEMRPVKHYYSSGVKARDGIER
ncbi:MAG: cob(I)yrinic acid a,c-diamide adenosyltransferase [Peptococcaceae bacterium]|nr:cob(I)yrinic acid a,c-diamide adenosyltransferase [Peptococcaceae bacterium]MDH7525785.1 cob(I)yrinic acid a,c-diamide adenosyltransferase [Peptococcaceae bacterium]